VCCTLHFLHGEIQIIERKERVTSISGFPAFDQPLELVNRRSGDGVSACPKSPTVESLMPKSPDFASSIVSLVPHSPRDSFYGATHLRGSSRRCVLRRMNESGTEQKILGSQKIGPALPRPSSPDYSRCPKTDHEHPEMCLAYIFFGWPLLPYQRVIVPESLFNNSFAAITSAVS